LKEIPGAGALFESVPSLKDLNELRTLAKERGGDFEKLLNSTYDEIKATLEKKGKEAKDLSSKTASEAKDKATK